MYVYCKNRQMYYEMGKQSWKTYELGFFQILSR